MTESVRCVLCAFTRFVTSWSALMHPLVHICEQQLQGDNYDSAVC